MLLNRAGRKGLLAQNNPRHPRGLAPCSRGAARLPPRPRGSVFRETKVETTILHEEAEECDDTRVFLQGQPVSTRIVAEAAQELQDGTLVFEDLTAGMHRDDKARDYRGDDKDDKTSGYSGKGRDDKMRGCSGKGKDELDGGGGGQRLHFGNVCEGRQNQRDLSHQGSHRHRRQAGQASRGCQAAG